MLAMQADGHEITTVEGLATNGELTPLQIAFNEHHALQCGYCTPGILMNMDEFLKKNPDPTEDEIRHGLQSIFGRGFLKLKEASGGSIHVKLCLSMSVGRRIEFGEDV